MECLGLGVAVTHLLGLSHVAEEKSPHALHCTLLQLMGTPLVITNPPVESKNWIEFQQDIPVSKENFVPLNRI